MSILTRRGLLGRALAALVAPFVAITPHQMTIELFQENGNLGARLHVTVQGTNWQVGQTCAFNVDQRGTVARIVGIVTEAHEIGHTGYSVVRLSIDNGMVQVYKV